MCAHHRLSHSFPTRRSSDLAPTADDFVRRAGGYGSASPSPSGPPQPAPSGRRCSPSTRTLDEMKTADRHELVDAILKCRNAFVGIAAVSGAINVLSFDRDANAQAHQDRGRPG